MCATCDKARSQPLQKALATIAQAMQDRKVGRRPCLDALVGELMGMDSDGTDALDCETEELKAKP
jgi:hypothetical protein